MEKPGWRAAGSNERQERAGAGAGEELLSSVERLLIAKTYGEPLKHPGIAAAIGRQHRLVVVQRGVRQLVAQELAVVVAHLVELRRDVNHRAGSEGGPADAAVAQLGHETIPLAPGGGAEDLDAFGYGALVEAFGGGDVAVELEVGGGKGRAGGVPDIGARQRYVPPAGFYRRPRQQRSEKNRPAEGQGDCGQRK